MLRNLIAICTTLAIGGPWIALSAAVERPDFQTEIHPLLETYCYECHGVVPEDNDLKLVEYESELAFKEDFELLDTVAWLVEEHEMPPMRHAQQPSAAERERLLGWATGLIAELRNAKPDDPGVVVMPRINHREYDLVVRDLTGIELEIGKFLTEDGLAGAGFYNVGHAQTMTVGQFESFLSAAKRVVSHARAMPSTGVVWYDLPQAAGRDPEALRKQLVSSYTGDLDQEKNRQLKPHVRQLKREEGMVLGAYLEAAWQYHHRAALGMADADFTAIAAAYPVPLYPGAIEKIYTVVAEDPATHPSLVEARGSYADHIPMQRLQEAWRALPPPSGGDRRPARLSCAGPPR